MATGNDIQHLDGNPDSAGRSWRRFALIALILAAFCAGLYAVFYELRHVSVADITAGLSRLTLEQYLLAFAGMLSGYIALAGYDTLALRYTSKRLPFRKTAFASWTSYAIANAVGFSLLTGNAVRYRLYSKWGLTTGEIAIVAVVTGITLYLGALSITGTGLLLAPGLFERVFGIPATAAIFVGSACIFAIALFLWRSAFGPKDFTVRGISIRRPGAPLALAQVGLGALDWAAAGFVLFVLLPGAEPFGFLAFLPVYAAASMIGAVSGVPGGLGVFDAVILVLLPGAPAEQVAAALIGYRAIYFLVPLALAAAALGMREVLHVRDDARKRIAKAHDGFEYMAPAVFSGLALIAGFLLLASAVTPSFMPQLRQVVGVLPLAVVELSHFIASLVGVLLIFIALGLRSRSRGAWTAAVSLLVAGTVLSALKGAGLAEIALFGLMALLLASGRSAFYRKTALSDIDLSAGWLLAVAVTIAAAVWLGLFSYRHVEYRDDLFWTFSLDGDAPRYLRAIAGVAGLTLFILIWRLVRSPSSTPDTSVSAAPSFEALEDIIASAKGAHADANLALLGDKRFFLSESGQSFIMYGVRGDNWIAMGEPVGVRSEFETLLWRFREAADLRNVKPVFYSVHAGFLPLAIDIGLAPQKIGETAIVSLEGFTLEGAKRSKMRQAFNRAKRDGADFEIIPKEHTSQIMNDLRHVSDAWLEHHSGTEKGFTLGRFDPGYLCRFPIAVVRSAGEIVAFANVWSTPDKRELSIDLMRYGEGAPKGVMDYLFTELMLWGADNGYGLFDLGMAPLSGLEDHRLAPLMSRLGAYVFDHAESIYGFEGLRAYKDKFSPDWQPLYIAAPTSVLLPAALGRVALLTSGGLSGMLAK